MEQPEVETEEAFLIPLYMGRLSPWLPGILAWLTARSVQPMRKDGLHGQMEQRAPGSSKPLGHRFLPSSGRLSGQASCVEMGILPARPSGQDVDGGSEAEGLGSCVRVSLKPPRVDKVC